LKKPILVTSASSVIGEYVVKELSARGTPVRAMVFDLDRKDELRLPHVELVWGDLRDEDAVRMAMQDVDKVYLATPLAKDMLDLTKRLVMEAERAEVRSVVRQSFFGADQGRTVAHLLHRECEKVVQASIMDHTILRPNQLMQGFSRYFASSIKESGELRRPVGPGRTSFIDAFDVGRAAAFVLDGNWHSGRKYCLTGPRALRDDDVAKELSVRLGKGVRAVDTDPEETYATLLQSTDDDWKAKTMLQVLQMERASLLSPVTNDLKALTGSGPRSFAQFLVDNLASFKDEA
jgi:uncharacterized protein YbjT (DUF2867 family)